MTMMARSDGSRTAGSFLGKSLSYFALLAFTLFALYPITQIITIALRPSDQLLLITARRTAAKSSIPALLRRDSRFERTEAKRWTLRKTRRIE